MLKGFKTLSDYVVSTMVNDAVNTITNTRELYYSRADRSKIMEVLSKPSTANDKLFNAIDLQKKLVDSEIFNNGIRQETSQEE